jgi:ABC-2 type transport system permease protein
MASLDMKRAIVRAVTAVAAAVAIGGCSKYSPITSARIEKTIASTFANLVETQVSWVGLPRMTAAEVRASARCLKLPTGGMGSGEWVCTVIWMGPQGQSVRDAYDLFIATDGCYTASLAGESLGGPILKTKEGRNVRNLLYAFDGCFDTTT